MITQTENKPKILYVDDEEENLLVFRSSFRKHYDILTTNSVKEALSLLQDHPVDVILTDQRMPEMSGVEFLKQIPENAQRVHIILTGHSDIDAVVDALNSGKVYQYVSKPWEKEELHKTIENAMSQHQVLHLHLSGEQTNTPVLPIRQASVQSDQHADQVKRQLEESSKNVHLLGEIGQEIISRLTIESIIESSYENVNDLMDATVFGIGVYNPAENRIEFPGVIEKGTKLPFSFQSLEDESRLAVWCFTNQKEIIINDRDTEYNKYVKNIAQPKVGSASGSLIYFPLISKLGIIGVITVQSTEKNAYTVYDVDMLRNIAIYVATALENAKAYNLIEEQKKEIQQKNEELEIKVKQRTEQLEQKNEEVQRQRDELEGTYNKVKRLSEIGRQITSSLSLEKIIESTYENVNSLMDATVFGIGVYNSLTKSLEFPGLIEKGQKITLAIQSIEEENRMGVWCFTNKKDVFINDFQTEYNKYVKSIPKPVAGDDPESILYIPLITSDEAIGVITVQSFRSYAYNHYHLDILRSLASFITIAIQNSNSYQKMMAAFEQLKTTQSKLVESEKMASLGVLTAGVAHEINNPVNFISGGIQSLEENYNDISELLNLFLLFKADTGNKEISDKIDMLSTQLQVDQMIPEITELIGSIKNGAKRTAEIVKGLRNFSRLDESEMKKVKIEEGIDNTLVILNNRMRDRITVVKEYGATPETLCYPGQLNQVFMNLLHNAADAIEDKGTITIKTGVDNGNLKLTISDTGQGMPPEVAEHIFEPFFTTKPVGQGTGLGLSIAYSIIEKHKGTIEVTSSPGKGTTFHITLPVNK